MGTLSDWYIRQGTVNMQHVMGKCTSYYMGMFNFIVYFVNKYVECVNLCSEESMQRAVDLVKTVPNYSAEGEVS